MKESAGGEITISDDQILGEFELGDSGTTLYPYSGTVTDWAYAAGWEISADQTAVLDVCVP